ARTSGSVAERATGAGSPGHGNGARYARIPEERGPLLDERRRSRREDREHEQLRLGLTVPAEGMDLLDAAATGHGAEQLEPIDADTDLTCAGAHRGGAGFGLDPQGRVRRIRHSRQDLHAPVVAG